jgi:hypothetical protein
MPHMTAIIPMMNTILTYWFLIISFHHSPAVPVIVPELSYDDPAHPVLYGFFLFFKKGDYFLLRSAATSSARPIAAKIVTMPAGDFWVTPAAGTPASGACACTGCAADVPFWWRQ